MFTIVMPMDDDRFEQFAVTKRLYDAMPQKKEFIIPTRKELQVSRWLDDNGLMKDVRIIPYKHDEGYNASKALNIGVRYARSKYIIITSPEVKPSTDVLKQFSESLGKNIICQVADQDENGNLSILVSSIYRSDTPAMYFLALFNKADIEKINGWDEDFMKGYAYEDNDFGERFLRAGLEFEVREDIQGVHQYHPRAETVPNGLNINARKFHENSEAGVVYCTNGLKKMVE